jgi:hypothetical protein
MAPKEPIHLPLRWQFVPLPDGKTGAVRWKWCAYTQSGKLEMECKDAFDTLTECMEDAKLNGYEQR